MKNIKKSAKTTDICVLLILPIAVAIITILYNLPFLISSAIYFGLPAIYLSYKNKPEILRLLVFTIAIVLGGFMIDYFATADNAWNVSTIFPVRIFGLVPIEDIVWSFCLVYFVAIFYVNYFTKKHQRVNSGHIKILYLLLTIFMAFFCLGILARGQLHVIPYSYFIGFAIFIALPLLAFIFVWPKYIPKLALLTGYFIYVCLLQELLSLKMGHWAFLGNHYLGWVGGGIYRFPLEELVLYIILFAASITAYLIFFTDDTIDYKNILKRIRK